MFFSVGGGAGEEAEYELEESAHIKLEEQYTKNNRQFWITFGGQDILFVRLGKTG